MKVKIIADFPEILAADINVDTDKKVEFVLDLLKEALIPTVM